MTFNSALLSIVGAELLEPRICPHCGCDLDAEPGVTLIRVRGKKQKIVSGETIGARCADGKNTRTWMRKVPVVIVSER